MNNEEVEIFVINSEFTRVKRKGYVLLNRFMYGGNDFYLFQNDKQYDVCVLTDGEYISVWHNSNKDKNGESYFLSEIKDIFRKGYIKNNITKKDVELLVNASR